MALWIRKSTNQKDDAEKNQSSTTATRKKKDEKKGISAKRLDNLRIPHQLNVILKTIGSHNEYPFITKDLSGTGAFVICPDMGKYPFQQTSSILDCVVELLPPGKTDVVKIRFLGKIARIVEAQTADSIAGFGIRILQISMDHKSILDNYILIHGTPENSNNVLPQHDDHQPVKDPALDSHLDTDHLSNYAKVS